MRTIEITLCGQDTDALLSNEILNEEHIIEKWIIQTTTHQQVIKLLVEDKAARRILKNLENKSYMFDRVIIYTVEGTLPQVKETAKPKKIKIGRFSAISKEELYDDIAQPVNLSFNFILIVILSSFVAGIGILKDNLAILIGAMVIAPFLGPNISMAFGTTLGDWSIIKKSLSTGLIGTAIAIFISILWGALSPDAAFIQRDFQADYQDIILALVCGFAGVVSVISGQGTTLVGVMVAAALLPPLMRSGLLLGKGYYVEALNSFLIFSTNIVCINIAGIVTFYSAGIRPGKWWKKENANKKTRLALILWGVALLIVLLVIMLFKRVNNVM